MNPYAIIAGLLVFIGGITGAYFKGEHDGTNAERLSWQSRDNAELREANAAVVKLTSQIRDEERAHLLAMNTIDTQYQKEKRDAQTQRDRDVANALSGVIGLRFKPSTSVCAGGDKAGAVGSGTGIDHGAASIELPPTITADLYGIVDDADAVADQLRACQQVVLEDRGSGSSE